MDGVFGLPAAQKGGKVVEESFKRWASSFTHETGLALTSLIWPVVFSSISKVSLLA
ncbi:MAG: hypothetical protein ACRBM6_31360 [Geminicoccales bacterium]